MKERIKTIVLLLLIGMSLSMTKELWMQNPDEVVNIVRDNRKEYDEYTYPLVDMMSPNKYLLNFGLKNHTLLYDDSKHKLWKEGSKTISKLLSAKNIDFKSISNEEYLSYQKNKSLVFSFSENISTYILAKVLGVQRPNQVVDTVPEVDSIYIYLGKGDPFFVFSNNKEHIKIDTDSENIYNNILASQLSEIEQTKEYPYYYSMRETLGTENDIFIPYETNYSLPKVYVENKVILMDSEQRDELAEKFLEKNIDYIREIVESNDSSIYLYEEKILKLKTNGVIEYFNPLDDRIKERNLFQSLVTAAEFLDQKSKIKDGMYLAKIEKIKADESLGYKFTIKYRIRGIPVILGNQEVTDYVTMEVFNNHVRNYIHYTREDTSKVTSSIMDKRHIMSAFDVIDKNYPLLQAKYLEKNKNSDLIDTTNLVNIILSSINDITLAYLDPCLKDSDEELIAVWVLQFDDLVIAFDAYSGMLNYIRNI